MAIVYVEEFEVGDDRSTTNYDAVSARLNFRADPPKGMIVHTAGFVGDRFRVVDVWETEEDRRLFYEGRVMPAVREVMSEAGAPMASPPQMYAYHLHDLVRG